MSNQSTSQVPTSPFLRKTIPSGLGNKCLPSVFEIRKDNFFIQIHFEDCQFEGEKFGSILVPTLIQLE